MKTQLIAADRRPMILLPTQVVILISLAHNLLRTNRTAEGDKTMTSRNILTDNARGTGVPPVSLAQSLLRLPQRHGRDARATIRLALTLTLMFLFASVASASTYTVTKTADTDDGACNADCSLREAINSANASSNVDTIAFNIPGGGVKTITLSSGLPAITEPVTVNGTTQPGYSGSPLIELNGVNLSNGTGLSLMSDVTVRGLIVNRFPEFGIQMGTYLGSVWYIPSNFSITVAGCYIGTNAAGTAALGNDDGIVVINTGPSTIGGTSVNDRNIISGNSSNGIFITEGDNLSIKGNFIGTDVTGTLDVGNALSGIHYDGAGQLTIGGTTAAARNVISGNNAIGVLITKGNATLQNNYIGTNAAGTGDLGNSLEGVAVYDGAWTVVIGGSSLNAANVISGNNGNGIEVQSAATIQGNKIGTNAAGTADLGNSKNGIYVLRSQLNGPAVEIGSTSSGYGNLISGNNQNGITVEQGPNNGQNLIKGNQIGVTNDGSSPLGNTLSGIFIATSATMVGESGVANARNIIAGNNGDGITLSGTAAHHDVIENNLIGTNSSGALLPNGGKGIQITGGAHDNRVGGSNTATNTIVNNFQGGVIINGATSINNAVQANSIYSNLGLGIDLGTSGVTPNDGGDADSGPNNLQNFPVIQAAFPNRIMGTINSEANKTYTLDFYRSTSCDTSGNGEGEVYLGGTPVITNAGGTGNFDVSVSLSTGQIVTATATDANGNTSEFSPCFVATATPGSVGFSNATYSVNENAGTATITVTRAFGSAGAISVDYATSNGSAAAGQDYTAKSGTLFWGNGDSASKSFTVPITDDSVDELNETVNLALSNASIGVGILTGTAVLTITDNDNPPALSITDVSKAEGNSGPTNFVFNISLSAASGQAVVVDYVTLPGTATAGIDYTPSGDTLVFDPGQTSKLITVAVNGDLVPELDETFIVELQDPQNATLAKTQGAGSVLDDDNPGKLKFSFAPYNVNENAGPATITVTRINGSAGTISVDYATTGGTATPVGDYTPVSGTLIFGNGETVKTFAVPIIDDAFSEPAETVTLALSNPNGGASLGAPATATLNILDNDNTTPIDISGKITDNNHTPLLNVTLNLTGAQTASTATDAQGNYTFSGLTPNGNYAVSPSQLGYTFSPINRSYQGLSSSVSNADFTATAAPSRQLLIAGGNATPGQPATVTVQLVAQGDENSVGFSLNFDQTLLSNPQAALGADAGAASLITNNSQAPAGHFSVLLSLPAGQTFGAGTHSLVVITFNTSMTGIYSTPVTFGDAPLPREVANLNADPLPSNYLNGTITFSQGYEADVAPRPTGSNNGSVTAADFTQLGRFVAGLDNPDQLNEFQRADCAPRISLGNGVLTVADYTQAGRYAAGLDVATPTGGAAVPNTASEPGDGANANQSTSVAATKVYVVDKFAMPGAQIVIPIATITQGTENSFGFSLNYDATKLSNPLVTLGSGAQGASLIPNTMQSGKVGVVLALPFGQAMPAGSFSLVNVRFDVAPNASAGPITLTFGDVPVFGEIADVGANPLPKDFQAGTLTILGPTAATVSVMGQITELDGRPVAGVTIALTGGSTTFGKAITDISGRFTFANVEADGFYTLVAERANYTFSPAVQAFSLLGNKTDANFNALPLSAANANPLETPEFFVRQQYLDFLGREPEQAGLDYWSRQLHSCNGDETCLSNRHRAVSAAFFIEQEFQDTGSFVYRVRKASLGVQPSFDQFTLDHKRVIGSQNIESRKRAFINEWTSRPEFKAEYPDTMAEGDFVNKLYDTAGLMDYATERSAAIQALTAGTKTRGEVLRDVIETPEFKTREYHPSFVLTQYFGYLRRNPDQEGYQFWLNVLDQQLSHDQGGYHAMVCAFITSQEYQQRFSPVVMHSNGECQR